MRNEAQQEAIEVADAHTNNCLLPTYSELVSIIRQVVYGGVTTDVLQRGLDAITAVEGTSI